jgi:hypothetical protein
MIGGTCPLHAAAIESILPEGYDVGEDPTVLVNYRGPEQCPPGEKCNGVCDLARLYRSRSIALRHNQEVPLGEHPAEVWTRLVLLVRATSTPKRA